MALQLGHCLPVWVLGWKAVCWPNHASDVVSLVSILSKGLVERTWAEADCLEGSLSCLMVEFDLLTGFPVNGLWFIQLFSIWKDEVWDSWPQAENTLSIDVFDFLSYIVGFFFPVTPHTCQASVSEGSLREAEWSRVAVLCWTLL